MDVFFRLSRFHLLVCVTALQLAILAGELMSSVYPLWVGEEIALAMRPVDPRSLFRGNYARLNFEIGMLETGLFDRETVKRLQRGTVVYVSLQRQGDHWQPERAALKKPEQGLFIRGRIERMAGTSRVRMRYGIEAYFAPPDRAKAIEVRLREAGRESAGRPPALARVAVAPGGKAALRDLVIKGDR